MEVRLNHEISRVLEKRRPCMVRRWFWKKTCVGGSGVIERFVVLYTMAFELMRRVLYYEQILF